MQFLEWKHLNLQDHQFDYPLSENKKKDAVFGMEASVPKT